jgi:hypothetical protein
MEVQLSRVGAIRLFIAWMKSGRQRSAPHGLLNESQRYASEVTKARRCAVRPLVGLLTLTSAIVAEFDWRATSGISKSGTGRQIRLRPFVLEYSDSRSRRPIV